LTSLLRSPSGSHTRGKGMGEGEGEGRRMSRRGEDSSSKGTPSIHLCQTLLRGGSLYMTEGGELTPTKAPRGGVKGRLGPAASPSMPQTLNPRPPWYVQNVSTFLNTFAVVTPLICVFWIQLTRTNVIFSRIALVSCFCAEIQLSGNILENTAKILFYQKTHGARIWDREGPGGHHTTWWRGLGLAAPGGGVAAPAISSTPPSAYIYPLTWKYRGFGVSPR
jgi:hypothetical protein